MDNSSKSWQQNDIWEKEIDLLKSIVNKTPLVETTKWGGIVYTYNNKNVLGIGGFKSYFGIWFFNGVGSPFLVQFKSIQFNIQFIVEGLSEAKA